MSGNLDDVVGLGWVNAEVADSVRLFDAAVAVTMKHHARAGPSAWLRSDAEAWFVHLVPGLG
jgi:hypothetical protein